MGGSKMRLDCAIHDLYDAMSAGAISWKDCKDYGGFDDTYEWYYAEDRLYVIRHKKLHTCFITRAKSPEHAYMNLKHTLEW